MCYVEPEKKLHIWKNIKFIKIKLTNQKNRYNTFWIEYINLKLKIPINLILKIPINQSKANFQSEGTLKMNDYIFFPLLFISESFKYKGIFNDL